MDLSTKERAFSRKFFAAWITESTLAVLSHSLPSMLNVA